MERKITYSSQYKEPFIDMKDGYGYQGVLLFDEENNKIQCHMCGEWVERLTKHIHKHGINADSYRTFASLNRKTPLLTPSQIAAYAKASKKAYKGHLKAKKHHTEETKKKMSISHKLQRAETDNVRGTCTEQLLKRLEDWYKKNPKGKIQDIPFRKAIKRKFGSVKQAKIAAGIPLNPWGGSKGKWTREQLIELAKKFVSTFGRLPGSADMKQGRLPPYASYRWQVGTLKELYKELKKQV